MNSPIDASEPYVRDRVYRSSFVPAQAPILLSYVAASAGFRAPHPGRNFRYIELGCGSGATLNGLAAACPQGEFVGVDFNAGNIGAARRTASAAGLSNVTYIEAAFSELDAGTLAPADYVACMGTYSWLDDAEKAALIDIVRGGLKEGGLLCLGFVSLGRAAVTPMWQVLRALVPTDGRGSMERVKSGIGLLGELRDQGARYLQQNPQALALFNDVHERYAAGDTEALDNLSHNLLAEGYKDQLLNEVAAELATAGLEFCASAVPFGNDPDLCVPPALRARYDALPSRMAQEIFKDFLGATVVRTDVFIRNARPDAEAAQRYLMETARATLVGPRAETWQQLQRPGWTTFDFSSPRMRFAFDALADGAGSIGAIAAMAAGVPFGPDEIQDAFGKLIASPGIELCLDEPHPASGPLPSRIQPASGYNRLALDAALAGAAIVHLAAPDLGNCVPATLPGSLLLAEFCASGTAVPVAALHGKLQAQVARIGRIDPAAVKQFGDPQFFAQLHQVIIGRVLPMLLRFGALKAA